MRKTEQTGDTGAELNETGHEMPDNTVVLRSPVTRGEMTITEVTITKAMCHPGALRGLKLFEVMQGDVESLIKLLPRVTSPQLTEADVYMLDNADFSALGLRVVGFFAR
ncbi:phage tail protein E [Escherichia coli M056]|uniref:phage tail assembly protein n=1 Tax=Escherichia coli TaxID=562 RepID=UPI000A18483D|nr:phage tail assembly protein [Escherichia coli]OSK22891.1 phage tail protein E [Escherichia coli M056]